MTTPTDAPPAVAEVRKNATETLLVRWTEYNGQQLLDVRSFVEKAGTGELVPTRKGLTLRPETWQELLQALTDALAEGGDP